MNVREDRRGRGIVVRSLAVLTALFFLSFWLGRYDVPPGQVLRMFLSRLLPLSPTWTPQMETAVMRLRLPRILLAIMVGGGLSAAGTAYQSVFRTPMAAPDSLGASSGACFGAALGILLDLPRSGVIVLAFAWSLLSLGVVYTVSRRTRGARGMTLLLSGMVTGALFSACTSYIKLVADPTSQLPAITYWIMGSLSGARLEDVAFGAIPMLVGLAPLYVLRWRINLLTLSREEAQTMGIRPGRVRLAAILCATVLTAASVSLSGMIGWVGLIVPHLSRRMVGNDCRYLLPAATLMGGIFLLLTDNVSRTVLPVEIPLGILTALVGAPFFLYLMTGKEGRV